MLLEVGTVEGAPGATLLGTQALWGLPAPSSGQASSTLCSRPPLRHPIVDMAPSAPDLSPADKLRPCPLHTVSAGSRLSRARWSWGAAPAPRGLMLGSMDFGDTAFSPPVPACCFPSVSLPLHADARLSPAKPPPNQCHGPRPQPLSTHSTRPPWSHFLIIGVQATRLSCRAIHTWAQAPESLP